MALRGVFNNRITAWWVLLFPVRRLFASRPSLCYDHATMVDTFWFDGFSLPQYTQVPNQIFDQLLPHVNEGELKVLLYIVRRTFGFQRDSDNISLKQMTDGIMTRDGRQLDQGVGLSKSAVARALQGLQVKGIIIVQRNRDPERGDIPTTYRLRLSTDQELST